MINKPIAFALAPVLVCMSTLMTGSPVAANLDVAPFTGSAATVAPSTSDPTAAVSAHRVGQIFNYSLHGEVGQSISGRDATGRTVDQRAITTTLTGRERIAVRQTSPRGITLHRSGAITASVAGRPVSKPGTGWTLVNGDGTVVRDHGTLGGLFLLPLGFLGERAVNRGAALSVGSSWSGKLGTKLYGMTARPQMKYSVTGTRYILGTSVFSIVATGSVPMKEPVVTNMGETLGYATGKAYITLHFDYDRANARVVAMDLRVQDDLRLSGTAKAAQGNVSDVQRYLVALDAGSISASAISRSL
ncbi:MAG TPA: hypothetical protein VII69_06030 [Candidatus Eremiobacteraceae bacterium]